MRSPVSEQPLAVVSCYSKRCIDLPACSIDIPICIVYRLCPIVIWRKINTRFALWILSLSIAYVANLHKKTSWYCLHTLLDRLGRRKQQIHPLITANGSARHGNARSTVTVLIRLCPDFRNRIKKNRVSIRRNFKFLKTVYLKRVLIWKQTFISCTILYTYIFLISISNWSDF